MSRFLAAAVKCLAESAEIAEKNLCGICEKQYLRYLRYLRENKILMKN